MTAHLCIGGPLDGQWRECAGDYMRAIDPSKPPVSLSQFNAPPKNTVVKVYEYRLTRHIDGGYAWLLQ